MPAFRARTLASGSSGNATLACAADGAVLVDAGLSAKRLLAALDGQAPQLRAVVITHDHTDHLAGAAVLGRRLGIPVWMSAGTREAGARALARAGEIRLFRPGESFEAGGFRVETLATPHDAAEPAAVTLDLDGARCGVWTDLGHAFPALPAAIAGLDALFLESNFDPELLRAGPYPPWLQARIRGPRGHLANAEAAELIERHAGIRLRTLVLSHLSEKNNRPDLALAAFAEGAPRLARDGVRLFCAPRHEPGEWVSVG